MNINDQIIYPDVPQISLELTNKCNLKCPYCGNRNLTRPRGEIKWELLEKLVDDCSNNKHDIAWLHGTGEPLLYPRLEEAIALIRKHKAGSACFATNGTLLNRERVKKLLDAGLVSLYVSLDSLDPDIYKQTRGVDLQKVVANIMDMLAIVPKDFCVIIALMQSKLQPMSQNRIDEFNQLFGSYENVKLNNVENTLFPASGTDYRLNRNESITCNMPHKFFTIACDGRVSLCCVDQDVQCSIGDINENCVSDIWLDAKTQQRFKAIALGESGIPSYCSGKCFLMGSVEKNKMLNRRHIYLGSLLNYIKHNYSLKNYQTAQVILNKYYEIDDSNAVACTFSGLIEYDQKRYEKALHYFLKAIEIDSTKPQLYFYCGLAQEKLEYTDDAILSFERALARNPTYQQAYGKLIHNLQKREKVVQPSALSFQKSA